MKHLLSLALLALAFFSVDAYAQKPYWTQTNGPQGGTVSDVTIDSTGRVIISTRGSGIYRSLDNGDTWHLFNAGLPNLNMKYAEAGKNGYIFAGNQDLYKQIFRLDENSPNPVWEEITSPIDPLTQVTAMVAHPNGKLYFATPKGIQRSDDNGNNWTRKNKNLIDPSNFPSPDSAVKLLALDANGNIFAATQAALVFKSTDNGESWTALPTRRPGSQVINAMGIAANGNIVIGNKGTPKTGGNLYVSTNMGLSWDSVYTRPANTDEERNNIDEIIRIPGSSVMIANAHGITLRSLDNGLTWETRDSDKRGDEPFSIAAYGTNLYQMSEPDGIFLSKDEGANWVSKTKGLQAEFLWGLSLNSKNKLFGITEYGLHRSVDNGDTWDVAPEYGETYFPSLYIDHHDNIFIGTDKGLFKSTDDGETLKHVVIALDTNGSNIIIQTGESPWGKHYLSSRLYKIHFAYSTDGGDTWDKQVPNFPTPETPEAFAFGSKDTLIAATISGEFYISVDKGETFNSLKTTIAGPKMLSIHPDGSYLALIDGVSGGVFRSKDGGKNWVHIFPPENSTSFYNYYYSMMVDSKGTIIVCTDSGIYRSVENNPSFSQWSSISTGMTANDFPNHYIGASAVVENLASHIYFAGSRGLGVFKSVPYLNGVPTSSASAISALPIHVYPNPTQGSVNISFTSENRGEVNLDLFDQLGRKVTNIYHGNIEAGQTAINFDGSALATGTYMLVLQQAGTTSTSWITLVK